MRIIFSRKGFDSASGGGPSPIVDGRPVSLPIPAGTASRTTYGDLGLADQVARASKGRLGADDLCHHDPMFLNDGTCLFGQCGAAQTHLANRGVGVGDVFVFFGLFREPGGSPHHRIFGYLEVKQIAELNREGCPRATALAHPHALALHAANDTIYSGPGRTAKFADDLLCLTAPGESPSVWQRPAWLKPGGLSYHDRADRWLRGERLRAVSRGQEFVADVGRRQAPRDWLAAVIATINRS
ncbi:MAG: hypothetical protein ABGW87_09450 [Sphingomonadaceae bacterium]